MTCIAIPLWSIPSSCPGTERYLQAWREKSPAMQDGSSDMTYPVLIDGEPGGYGVVFPDLPGCVAMGTTVEEALRNAEGSLRDWVESMEAHGRRIPEPSNPQSIRVPEGSSLEFVSQVRAEAV